MQIFMSTMLEHFERMNKQLDKQLEQSEQLREGVKAVHDKSELLIKTSSDQMESMKREIRSLKQEIIATIRQEPNTGEKKQIEAEDEEVQTKPNEGCQVETGISVPEEVHVPEIQEKGVTLETSAVEFSGRQGEPEAPNERCRNEKVTEGTNSKPRKRRVGSLAAAGARRKKKKYQFSMKWESRRKTTQKKSQKEAFQQWMDNVRKKHRNQTNNVRHQMTRQQRHVPWDPGGFIYETRSSQVPDHRSQSPSLIATSTLCEATTFLRYAASKQTSLDDKLIRSRCATDQEIRRESATTSAV
jgi:hypothetical protein